jgi:imidazolonepropionase-like amidohydrolase
LVFAYTRISIQIVGFLPPSLTTIFQGVFVNIKTIFGINIFVIFFISGCVNGSAQEDKINSSIELVVTNVNVIDVVSGEVVKGQTILISGEKILKIVPTLHSANYPNAEVVDGTNKFAIPGLWDMHDHHIKEKPFIPWDTHTPQPRDKVQKEIFLPLYVGLGITGIREMSGTALSLSIKKRLQSGEWLGPDYVVGSPILDGPFPIWSDVDVLAIKSPKHAREVVRRLHKEGYDFLKPYSMLTADSYRALADEARKLGMVLAGELPLSISAWEAAELGQKSMEHLTGIELACTSNEETLRAKYRSLVNRIAAGDESLNALLVWNQSEWEPIEFIDERKCEKLLAHLSKFNVWITPTLIIQQRISRPNPRFEKNNPNFKYTENLRNSPEDLIAEFDPLRKLVPVYDRRSQFIDNLVNANVKVLAGSDENGGFPLHEELALFVESGLSPLQALQTATINPAKFLGREDSLGSIASGKRADIVLLSKNPLLDIRNTLSIEDVFLKGVHFDRDSLNYILKQVAADAEEFPSWWAKYKKSLQTNSSKKSE